MTCDEIMRQVHERQEEAVRLGLPAMASQLFYNGNQIHPHLGDTNIWCSRDTYEHVDCFKVYLDKALVFEYRRFKGENSPDGVAAYTPGRWTRQLDSAIKAMRKTWKAQGAQAKRDRYADLCRRFGIEAEQEAA